MYAIIFKSAPKLPPSNTANGDESASNGKGRQKSVTLETTPGQIL